MYRNGTNGLSEQLYSVLDSLYHFLFLAAALFQKPSSYYLTTYQFLELLRFLNVFCKNNNLEI